MNIMNRCINALRKLQTERGIRSQAVPETDVPAGLGLMDLRQVAKTKPRDTDAEPETAPNVPPTLLVLRSTYQILSVLKPSRRRATNGRWVRIVNRPQHRKIGGTAANYSSQRPPAPAIPVRNSSAATEIRSRQAKGKPPNQFSTAKIKPRSTTHT